MNSQQAKKIDLPDLLSRLGYEPIKANQGGREVWYKSPFRKEKTPSFHTTFKGGKWIWNDFGDSGGNVIDFVMRHEGVSFKEALAFLRSTYQGSLFENSSRTGQSSHKPPSLTSFQQHSDQINFTPEQDRGLKFLEAYELRDSSIISYLENKRKIPVDLAKLYLKEVSYLNKAQKRTYCAFGMKNESGGYEIRAASDEKKFKSVLIKRDFTLIQGKGAKQKSVSIFEGMTDFLSLLVLQKIDQLKGDALIMHSVTTYNRTLHYIKEQEYKEVFTFLDNDQTGEKYTARFKKYLPPLNVYSQNQSYKPYKDLNDALVARMKKNLTNFDYQPL